MREARRTTQLAMFVPPDLQETVKPIGMCRALGQGWFTGSDEDGGAQTNIAASGASN